MQEGCGTLNCANRLFGSSDLIFQPCTDPPSILSRFYNASNVLVREELLTENATVVFGTTSFIFSITQLLDGIGLEVN